MTASIYLQLNPTNPCHLTMQKWTTKASYVKSHTLSRAITCKNRRKLNSVVISQLPTSTATAGKAGGTWELMAALLRVSTTSTSTNQSSDRPVLIWATAVGPTLEEQWHKPFLASSSCILLPPCLQNKPMPQPPVPSKHRALPMSVLSQACSEGHCKAVITECCTEGPTLCLHPNTSGVKSLYYICTWELLNTDLQSESSFHTASKTFTKLCHFKEVYKICN